MDLKISTEFAVLRSSGKVFHNSGRPQPENVLSPYDFEFVRGTANNPFPVKRKLREVVQSETRSDRYFEAHPFFTFINE